MERTSPTQPTAEPPPSLILPGVVSLAEALTLAIHRLRGGDFEAADQIFSAVLAVRPDHPDALHFRGVLAHHRGDHAEAVALIERAAALIPEHADVHNNLGNVYRETGRFRDARTCYEQALSLDSDHCGALNNLGLLLRLGGDTEAAVATLERANALDPDNPDVLVNLGNAYRTAKRFHDAVSAYRRSIARRPYQYEAYKYLAYTLYFLGDRNEAIHLLRQWLAEAPDNPTARHLWSAYSGLDIPDRASDAYVRETFGNFAGSFDEVLAGLGYQAPQLVMSMVADMLGKPSSALTVLDAGCGTGLIAPMLRPYAARLIGVDLSPEMLERARARGLYDALVEAELTAYIGAHQDTFDLIVAADTICYLGRLDGVWTAVAQALRPGGCFVFTLERLNEDNDGRGFRLNVHGRYSHHPDAVRDALEWAGLAVASMDVRPLRRELGKDVEGLLVAARRA